jgi:ligand-binding sensor domain-containing protein
VASLPIDAKTGATTYFTENAAIGSNNVKAIAIGQSPLRWIGTDKGIAAFENRRWLKPSYETTYPESTFEFCPITSMATSRGGDTLYVGTEGAGVARVFKNTKVDAISGASEYAQWGTILMPSDSVYSIFIDPKGDQWIGTNRGAALHKGNNTLGNWKVFDLTSGLIDNFVQAITMDNSGKVWFGTKNGISVLNGSSMTSYTDKDGLVSNNVLCITTDRDGIVWIGTDNGVSSFKDGVFTSYRASN